MTLPRSLRKHLPVLLFVTAALAPGQLRAADYDLLFSDKTNDKAPHANVQVRPTVQQQLFVYVRNNTDADGEVKVELLAGDLPIDAATQVVPVAKKETKQVRFGAPPAPPPAAPPAPAGPKPPAAPKPPPPALEEVQGALQLRISDKEGKQAYATADLNVSRPSDYIKIDDEHITYNPKPENGKTNQLTVTVKAEKFTGPKCRVDLVLRPDRIPGLIDSPDKHGNYGGYISPGQTLTLTAEDLVFDKNVKGKNALVYLTIDGWQRAYTFKTTFLTDEGQPGIPRLIQNTPIVRFDSPKIANPGAPYPVRLEVDNAANDVVQLQLLGTTKSEDDTEAKNLVRLPGDRKVHMLVGASGPGGCLLLQPQVEDWKAELDTTNVFGERSLQVVVLGPAEKNGDKVIEPKLSFYGSLPGRSDDPQGKKVDELTYAITLDAAPPKEIQFVDFPAKLPRKDDLPVKAKSADVAKDIKEVFFYLGAPGPDGNPPPTAVKVPGKLVDKDANVWAASLVAPTGVKGTFEVSALFVKVNEVAGSQTTTIQLVDPPAPPVPGAPGAAKGGSIAGVVAEGGRGQPGIEVKLLDDKNAVKDATKTDPTGKFLFKDVAAGSYKVVSVKTTDSTKGETAVEVLDGKDKIGVDIKLQR